MALMSHAKRIKEPFPFLPLPLFPLAISQEKKVEAGFLWKGVGIYYPRCINWWKGVGGEILHGKWSQLLPLQAGIVHQAALLRELAFLPLRFKGPFWLICRPRALDKCNHAKPFKAKINVCI